MGFFWPSNNALIEDTLAKNLRIDNVRVIFIKLILTGINPFKATHYLPLLAESQQKRETTPHTSLLSLSAFPVLVSRERIWRCSVSSGLRGGPSSNTLSIRCSLNNFL